MAASARPRSLWKTSIPYSDVGRGRINWCKNIEIQGQGRDFSDSLEGNGMPASKSTSRMLSNFLRSSPVHNRSTSTAAASVSVATSGMRQSLQVENPCRYSALHKGQNINALKLTTTRKVKESRMAAPLQEFTAQPCDYVSMGKPKRATQRAWRTFRPATRERQAVAQVR